MPTINVSWKLSPKEFVNILAYRLSHDGAKLPTSRKQAMTIIRRHLRDYGDSTSYEETSDEAVEEAQERVRDLFAEWAKELGMP